MINSKGFYLINKETSKIITNQLKQDFKINHGIKFPQKSKTVDIVEISNINNPGNTTSIVTFYDKNKKIAQRNIIENIQGQKIETQKNYKTLETSSVFDPSDPEEYRFLDVEGRKISSVTKIDGVYVSKQEEVQTHTQKPDGTHIVNISKIKASPMRFKNVELESQSMYEYSKEGKKGYTIQETGKGKFGFSMDRDDILFENMENTEALGKDKYLPVHLYSFKQFKKMAPTIARHPEHIPLMTEIKWYSMTPVDNRISYGYYDGSVHLNKKTLKDRFKVIKTAAHEKEHEHQRFASQRNTEEGQLYREAEKNYVQPEVNFAEYKKNLKEQKAREAGRLALRDYQESADNLKSQFPYAPNYQIGYSFKDENQNMSLRNLLDSLNLDN